MHPSREVYVCFLLLSRRVEGKRGIPTPCALELCLGVLWDIFLSLFICSIQSKAERVKWGREKKNRERMMGSAKLGKLSREGLYTEISFE